MSDNTDPPTGEEDADDIAQETKWMTNKSEGPPERIWKIEKRFIQNPDKCWQFHAWESSAEWIEDRYTKRPPSKVVEYRVIELVPATRAEEFERALEEIAGPCGLPHRCGQRNRYCDPCIATRALVKHRGEG